MKSFEKKICFSNHNSRRKFAPLIIEWKLSFWNMMIKLSNINDKDSLLNVYEYVWMCVYLYECVWAWSE